MPFGFDDAAAVIGVIGFSLNLFQMCIKGLVLLSKARTYERDASGIKLMIELEIHKLHAWAAEVGLTRCPPTLLVDTGDALMVPKILDYLGDLVTDLEKLKNAYGIQVQQTSDVLTTLDEEDSALDRLGIGVGDECKSMIAGIFKQSKKPWKRLRWVVIDEGKIQRLLNQVQHFIKELQLILNRAQQAKLQKGLDLLLRNAVMSTANKQELDMLGAGGQVISVERGIAAAARLKNHGLLLGILETTEASNDTQHSKKQIQASINSAKVGLEEMRLSTNGLSIVDYNHHETRFLARLNNAPVLLEFKNVSDFNINLTKDRICKVSAFLHHLDTSFHGLSCLGYVKAHDRYAHVFDLKEHTRALENHRHLPSYRTLRQLLLQLPLPSLNLRFSFALTIMETLLQLHTAGWLHKGFRPENILFFSTSHRKSQDFLHADVRVTGYAYARADELQEMTEPLQSETEADLYRHPAYLQRPRVPFQRAFDIFSVGCLLLEIGLWCTLPRLFTKTTCESGDNVDRRLDLMQVRQALLLSTDTANGTTKAKAVQTTTSARDIFRQLEGCAGRAYTDVVKDMINVPVATNHGIIGSTPPAEHDLVRLEIESLEKLRTVFQVL